MAAVCGSREFYDRWANTVGGQWSYNNIVLLFQKVGRKLLILIKSTVNKIIFKKNRNTQTDVDIRFTENAVCKIAYARKGIIISVGISSSVILQRSGIGKTEDLSLAGIPTIIENPNVENNFQTQYYVSMGVEVEASRLLTVLLADPIPIMMGAFQRGDNASRQLKLLSLPAPALLPIQDVFINDWEF